MWRGGLSSASLRKKYPSLSLLSPRESSREAKHSYASFPKPHFCFHKETGELTKGKGPDKQVRICSQSTSSSFQIALSWGEPEDDTYPGQGPRALSVSKLNVQEVILLNIYLYSQLEFQTSWSGSLALIQRHYDFLEKGIAPALLPGH